MKTRNVITVIGAVALAAIILNLNAAAPLPSPRAKDRQITASPTPARDRNFATENRNVIGCPRGNEAIPKTAVANGCCATVKTAYVAPPACCAKQ